MGFLVGILDEEDGDVVSVLCVGILDEEDGDVVSVLCVGILDEEDGDVSVLCIGILYEEDGDVVSVLCVGILYEEDGDVVSVLCVGILDEEDGDVLINVNMLDNEKASVNVENKLKKPTYKPYDEDEFEEDGLVCTVEPCYNVLRSSFGQAKLTLMVTIS